MSTPGHASLYARDLAVHARLQKLRFFPSALTGGQGCRVFDDSGRTLLDFSSSCGAVSLGHGHPAYVAAVERAVRSPGGATVLTNANLQATELAERLLAITPGTGERRVWFGHSGSDANEAALRAARLATGRERVLCFEGSYHGGSAATIAISGHKTPIDPVDAARRVLVPFPDGFRGDDSGASVLADIERRFATDVPPSTIAAAFIEPLQGDGGYRLPPPGFLSALAQLCARHGIVLVCDEVKMGLGRSGLLHCFEHEGLTPDIVTFGKGLGGGLPLSAVVGTAAILDVAPAYAMQTLQGNPVCAAAGLAVLETVERERLADNAAAVGDHLRAQLQALAATQPLIGEVRGRGLAIGVDLVSDRGARTPATRETAQVVYRCFETGLLLYYVGMDSNVLEIIPPLTLSRAEAEEGVSILAAALDDVAAGRFDAAAIAGFEGW